MSARRLLSLVVVAALALGGFVLGAAYIWMGSLAVRQRFEVRGQPVVLAGQPAVFRVWAYSNDPPGPLSGGTLRLAIDGTDSEASVALDVNGAAVATLDIPEAAGPGPLTVNASVSVSGQVVEEMPFEVEVLDTREARPSSLGASPDGEPGLRAELIVPNGYAVPYLENRVYVRVTERPSWRPAATTVKIENIYGTVDGQVPTEVRTDVLGLAELRLLPLSETDWRLTIEDSETETVVELSLPTVTSSILIHPQRYVLAPGQPLRVDVASVRGDGTVFADIVVDGAWLDTHRAGISEAQPEVAWTPRGLKAPSTPRIATLLMCFSEIACDEANAGVPLVWSAKAVAARETLQALGEALAARGRDAAYVAQLEAILASGVTLPEGALERAIRAVAARYGTVYQAPQALLRTEPISEARLQRVKDAFRARANLLSGLLVAAGAIFLGAFVLRSSSHRRRALGDVLLEAELDGELDDEPAEAPSAVRLQWATMLEIGALVVTLAVAVGGMLLLFQEL